MMNEESIQQKLKSLRRINLQDEVGLKTAIATLDDPVLEVRVQAYWLLKDCEDCVAKNTTENGVKLNPGDKVYCVHESGMSYNDEFYTIHDKTSDLEFHLFFCVNAQGKKLINDKNYLERALAKNYYDEGFAFNTNTKDVER